MKLLFEKMEGIGNDFIMLDDREGEIAAFQGGYPAVARCLCSRNFGIGGDGIILMLKSATEDIGFRIFNSDGSEAQMCGNGMRCFAKYLFEHKIIAEKRVTVETRAGRVIPEIITDDSGRVKLISVDMGEPVLDPAKVPFVISDQATFAPGSAAVNVPINVDGKNFNITAVSMGNPHAVLFVDDVTAIEVKAFGSKIENHPAFPQKTNVEFIEMIDREQMHMRVWERGAGETLACGTGACAALVAAVLNGKSEREATVHLKGGSLEIEWRESDNHLYKTGAARSVFKGSIEL